MYFAYAISLMYFLRSQDDAVVEKVLNRLPITKNACAQLIAILKSNAKRSAFSEADTVRMQDILGLPLRQLAATAVREEFLSNPTDTQLYAVSAYQMYANVIQHLPRDLASTLQLSQDSLGNFSAAEIFKVKNMQSDMDAYAKSWVAGLNLSDCPDVNRLEKLINQKTIEFFKEKNNEKLQEYTAHLSKDTTWGSEETLLCLNRALSGETRLTDGKSFYIAFDPEIKLGIMQNGGEKFDRSQQPDIILNNLGQAHWVSAIPDAYLQVPCIHSSDDHRLELSESQQNLLIDKVLDTFSFFKNKDDQESYKQLFYGLKNKQLSSSDSLDQSKQGESDEEYAKLLQAAEVQELLKKNR